MVDANTPWSLKGISDEARDYARQAAAGTGLPIGAWLSSVINAAAHQEQSSSMPITDDTDDLLANISYDESPGAQVSDGETNTIERAVQIVSDFGFEPEGPARDVDLIDDADILMAEIDALEQQLVASENRSQDALSPLVAEIENLRRRLESLG